MLRGRRHGHSLCMPEAQRSLSTRAEPTRSWVSVTAGSPDAGAENALVAVGRSVLVVVWRLLSDPQARTTSARTSTATASARNARHAPTSANSKDSATKSPSNLPPELPPHRPSSTDPSVSPIGDPVRPSPTSSRMEPPDCDGGPVGPHWCACRAETRSSAAAPRRACTSCCPRFLLQEFRSSATG